MTMKMGFAMSRYQLVLLGVLKLILIWMFDLSLAQQTKWSAPAIISHRSLGQIESCSNLALGPDQSVHISWIAKANRADPREKDSLYFMTIRDGNLLAPGSVFPCLKIMNYLESPWVVVDRDTVCHVFVVAKNLPGPNGFFDYEVNELQSIISSELPFYNVWGFDSIWFNRDTIAAKDIAASLTKYLMIYVAWEDFNRIWVTGKRRYEWSWSSRVTCPFPDFIPPKGSSRAPHLFAGRHDTLFLAFIGHTSAEVPSNNKGFWHFVHFTKKSLSANEWLEPALVYRDTAGVAQQPFIIVDQQRVRHIIWLHWPRSPQMPAQAKLFYSYSLDDHGWSSPQNIAEIGGQFGSHQIGIDQQGTLHVYWLQYQPQRGKPAGIYAAYGREDQWSSPNLVAQQSDSTKYDQIRVVIDARDRLHLIEKINCYPAKGEPFCQISYRWRDLHPTAVHAVLNAPAHETEDRLQAFCYPNPFNESVTLHFVAKNEYRLSVSICNVNGQRVKTLIDDVMVNKETQCVWDGRNERGEALPSGLYFFFATGYSAEQRLLRSTGKLMLIK